MCSDYMYVSLERNCCSQCVFMCLMHIGREHKRYWWTSLRVEARTCVVIKCICICVKEYATCGQARRHVLRGHREPAVHGDYLSALFILPMDANVTGGQAYELWSQEHA